MKHSGKQLRMSEWAIVSPTHKMLTHPFHAVFLPTCANWYTVSQPVKA